MHKAGIVALTDDGRCVQNHEVMRRALEYARMFGLVVMDHCQDYNLGRQRRDARRLLEHRARPARLARAGEEVIVQRNALLAELCGTPIHCQHLSAAGSARILREARGRGVKDQRRDLPAPHRAHRRVDPGLQYGFQDEPAAAHRARREALIEAVADGTINILASDHAPHSKHEKEVEFDQAPFGILGLETELGLFLDILVHKKKAVDLPRLVALLTIEPARLLKLDRGTLSVGAPADITLLDPDLEWTVDRRAGFSRSCNTPFHGWELKGRAVRTIVAGKTVWDLENGFGRQDN
jgi:dihydroorotase